MHIHLHVIKLSMDNSARLNYSVLVLSENLI